MGLIGAPESDVDVRDLASFFDFDDPGLFLVGRVEMIYARELSAPESKRDASVFAARADEVAPRRQPIDTINASVVRYEDPIIRKVTLILALLPLFIHCVKLYKLRDERRAIVVQDSSGDDAASDQREIYLLLHFAFIEDYPPSQRGISGTVGDNEGIQHCADDVAPLSQAAEQITTVAVSRRLGLMENGRIKSASRISYHFGLREGDHRIHSRFSGNGHTPTNRSRARAVVALWSLRARLAERGQKPY